MVNDPTFRFLGEKITVDPVIYNHKGLMTRSPKNHALTGDKLNPQSYCATSITFVFISYSF